MKYNELKFSDNVTITTYDYTEGDLYAYYLVTSVMKAEDDRIEKRYYYYPADQRARAINRFQNCMHALSLADDEFYTCHIKLQFHLDDCCNTLVDL